MKTFSNFLVDKGSGAHVLPGYNVGGLCPIMVKVNNNDLALVVQCGLKIPL